MQAYIIRQGRPAIRTALTAASIVFISRAWRAALARALEQLPEILQKHGASMKSQFDGFAEYVGAERNATN